MELYPFRYFCHSQIDQSMRPIQMVDTKTQYLKIKQEVDDAVLKVMESSAFINGPAVTTFSQSLASYLGVKHVIPCANGTDALQIAMMALDLQPGDEVITPSFTYIATTEVIGLLRLKPVFVEVDRRTFCMDQLPCVRQLPRAQKLLCLFIYMDSQRRWRKYFKSLRNLTSMLSRIMRKLLVGATGLVLVRSK